MFRAGAVIIVIIVVVGMLHWYGGGSIRVAGVTLAKSELRKCYEAEAPELIELEKRVGPVEIKHDPQQAAQWDDANYLWYVSWSGKGNDFGFGATLKSAVHEALMHSLPENIRAEEQRTAETNKWADERYGDAAVKRNIAKYEKIVAEQDAEICKRKPHQQQTDVR